MNKSIKLKKIIAREFLVLVFTVIITILTIIVINKIREYKEITRNEIKQSIEDFNKQHQLYTCKLVDIKCKKLRLYSAVIRSYKGNQPLTELSINSLEISSYSFLEVLKSIFNIEDNIEPLYKWTVLEYGYDDVSLAEFKKMILDEEDYKCEEYEHIKLKYSELAKVNESFFLKEQLSIEDISLYYFFMFFLLRYLFYGIIWSIRVLREK